jgi:hypothetical protein
MTTERQRMLELDAQRRAEAIICERTCLIQNAASREWRTALKAQRHREISNDAYDVLHRHIQKSKVREAGGQGKERGEAIVCPD